MKNVARPLSISPLCHLGHYTGGDELRFNTMHTYARRTHRPCMKSFGVINKHQPMPLEIIHKATETDIHNIKCVHAFMYARSALSEMIEEKILLATAKDMLAYQHRRANAANPAYIYL